MMLSYRPVQYGFLKEIRSMFPGKTVWTRKELHNFSVSIGFSCIPTWITNDPQRRSSRGVYSLPEVGMTKEDFVSLNVMGDTRGRPRKSLSGQTVGSP
jgi:hypothetical protein